METKMLKGRKASIHTNIERGLLYSVGRKRRSGKGTWVPREKGRKAGRRHSGVIIITLYTPVDTYVYMHTVHCVYKI